MPGPVPTIQFLDPKTPQREYSEGDSDEDREALGFIAYDVRSKIIENIFIKIDHLYCAFGAT